MKKCQLLKLEDLWRKCGFSNSNDFGKEATWSFEGKWISFERLVPDSQGEDGASLTFGEMNPELVETNEDGIAISSFSPLNQTGFAQLRVSVANEPDFTDDTYLQVFSGEAISLELIIPNQSGLLF